MRCRSKRSKKRLTTCESPASSSPRTFPITSSRSNPEPYFIRGHPRCPTRMPLGGFKAPARSCWPLPATGNTRCLHTHTPGKRCRHNLNYWLFGDYVGLGAGAHGKLSFVLPGRILRTAKPKQPRDYQQQVRDAEPARARAEDARSGAAIGQSSFISSQDLPFEFMLNALRLNAGFTMRDYRQRTGLGIDSVGAKLAEGAARGLLENHGQVGAPPNLGAGSSTICRRVSSPEFMHTRPPVSHKGVPTAHCTCSRSDAYPKLLINNLNVTWLFFDQVNNYSNFRCLKRALWPPSTDLSTVFVDKLARARRETPYVKCIVASGLHALSCSARSCADLNPRQRAKTGNHGVAMRTPTGLSILPLPTYRGSHESRHSSRIQGHRTSPALAATSSRPVRPSAKICRSKCAPIATRSTPASRKSWIPAAASTSSARNMR